jgi:hypothetical protein
LPISSCAQKVSSASHEPPLESTTDPYKGVKP